MATEPFPPSASVPWRADEYGEYVAIHDAQGVRIADVYAPTVAEDAEAQFIARLITAAPALLAAVRAAVATYRDRLLLLESEREWRPDDEYRDMKGHYTALATEATAALSRAIAAPHSPLVWHAGKLRTLRIDADRYRDGSLAIELVEGDEPYTTLSVCVEGVILADGEFVAKTYSENQGLLDGLVAAGAVTVVRTVPHDGLGTLSVCRLVG